jgi:hypothetical protein
MPLSDSFARIYVPGRDSVSNRGWRRYSRRIFAVTLLVTYARVISVLAQETVKPVFVGAVVTETISSVDRPDITASSKLVINPPHAAVARLTEIPESKDIQISVSFRRSGKVTVRISANGLEKPANGKNTVIRSFQVREWPVVPAITSGAVRGGVGAIVGSIESEQAGVEAGQLVRLQLKLTGPAAMSIFEAPPLVMRSDSKIRRSEIHDRPVMVEAEESWLEHNGRSMQRTWFYEWRAIESGTYRVEPLRVVHLDSSGRPQTRLVTGPVIQVRPRRLFRAIDFDSVENEHSAYQRMAVNDRQFGPKAKVLVSSFILTALFAAVLTHWCRGGFMSLRLSLALDRATTPERALAAWRSIDRALHHNPALIGTESRRKYDELCRRAFGANQIRNSQ